MVVVEGLQFKELYQVAVVVDALLSLKIKLFLKFNFYKFQKLTLAASIRHVMVLLSASVL